MGFRSLQHTRDRRSTLRGLCLPATFRLQGLVTLLTVSSLRSLAGFVSHRRRSWDSPFGASSSRKVSGRFRSEGPTYRSTCRYTLCRNTGPARQAAVPGFQPFRESLATDACLARPPLAAPLGLTLLGLARESLGQDFARPPPTRLEPCGPGTTEYRSASAWTHPLLEQAPGVAWAGPFRVPAPVRSRAFRPPSIRAI